MDGVVQLAATLVARHGPASTHDDDDLTTTVPLAGTAGHCDGGNAFDGRIGVRISAIFVILFGATLGKYSPGRSRLYSSMLTCDVQARGSRSLPSGEQWAYPSGLFSLPSSLARAS
jgi:hypothetical protein